MRDLTDIDEMFARKRPSLGLLKRLFPFVMPYWRLALVPVVLEFVFVMCTISGPHILKVTIDDFVTPVVMAPELKEAGAASPSQQGFFHSFVRQIRSVPYWAKSGIISLSMLMLLIALTQASISATQKSYVWRATSHTIDGMRRFLFRHLQSFSMEYFDREKLGRILARIDRDVDYLRQLFAFVPMLIVSMTFSMISVSFMLFRYDKRLFLIVILLMPVVLAASYASQKWGLPAYRKLRTSVSKMTSNLAENVSGVHVVQAFSREQENLTRYQRLLEEYRGHVMTGAIVQGLTASGMMVAFGFANAIVIAYAPYGLQSGRISIGSIPASIMYIGMLYWPLSSIISLYDQILSASAAAERVVHLMDTKPSIVDRPGSIDIPAIQGDIEFQNVFFRYDKSSEAPWILKDISFKARPGQTIALVGATGSGKTSIVNLITRFYEPQLGAVLIDGHNICSVTQESLHRQMGIVVQQNFLFSGTVMENLKYARPQTTDEEAIAAAKALGSHDLIEALADKYQTDVRERGSGISHGERQLICFTRAMIANPRILVLDEATSAVDTNTEILIQHALERLMYGRTTVVVAHRLSTVRHADSILVVKDGRIVESGTHDELVATGGTYAGMFEQFIGSQQLPKA